jgi:hypothetical protein
MKNHFLLISITLASLTSGLFALEMDQSKVLSITISNQGLTRISVQDEKIFHLFTSPAEAQAHVIHHESGHVFVSPQGLEGPISVSLVTQGGQTQDLHLIPKSNLKSQPLILEKPKTPLPKPKRSSLQNQAKEILKIFAAGGIAPGFKEVPSFTPQKRQLLEIALSEVRRFETDQFRLSLFEGVNLTDHLQKLSPLALTQSQDLALYVVTSEIKPEATGRVFIVQRKEAPSSDL